MIDNKRILFTIKYKSEIYAIIYDIDNKKTLRIEQNK